MIFDRFFIGGAGSRGGEKRRGPSWERRIREGRGERETPCLDGSGLERRRERKGRRRDSELGSAVIGRAKRRIEPWRKGGRENYVREEEETVEGGQARGERGSVMMRGVFGIKH